MNLTDYTQLRDLLDALDTAGARWRDTTFDLAHASIDQVEAAADANSDAAAAYANARDDVRQALARMRRVTESAEIAASLEREDAFYRNHARTEATS